MHKKTSSAYICHIYLPYLWFAYFGFAVSLLIFRGSSNPINYNMAQVGELFRIPYVGFREYWFLCTLFQIKLVHTAFECKSISPVYNTIFWVISFIILNCIKSDIPLYVYRFHFGMYFHAGYLLQNRSIINNDKQPPLIWAVILIVTASTSHFTSISCYSFSGIISAICMCLGLFIVFYAAKITPSLLVLAGSTSMVMFILHDYVIFAMTLMFKFTGIMSGVPFLAALLTFTLAVSVSLLVVKVYQNVKCLRWIEYIFYPGKLMKNKQA